VPNNIVKYDGKTNPSVWIEHYHLACRAGGADSNLFIIQFLPIYLADTSRSWLYHLPNDSIDGWEDLKEVFTGNLKGIYVRPGNLWDLKGCRQKHADSLCYYIWGFSQKGHKLPKICDADVISAFWSSMTYRTLVHELGHEQPKTTNELLDIATRHAFGEEEVETVFIQSSRKATLSGNRGMSTTATDKGTKRSIKSDKQGPRRRPHRVTVAANRDDDDNDKDANDSDEELMAAIEHDFKHQARLPVDHFEELLEATCLNHTYPIKHKLKECTMMKNYMTMGNLARNKKPEGDSAVKAGAPFPEEKAVMSIYGGLAPHESCRKLKLTGRAVNSMGTVVPEYLR
jgi:hypothetical protein